MAAPSVSMNISVFKDLNEQLQTVTAGTDIFRGKVVDLVKELQGLSQIVGSMPQGLSNLAQQMQAGGGQFSAQKVTQAFSPATPAPQSPAGQQAAPVAPPTATDVAGGINKTLLDFVAEMKGFRATFETMLKQSSTQKAQPPVPGQPTAPGTPAAQPTTPYQFQAPGRLGIFTEQEKDLAQRAFRQTGIRPVSLEETIAAERMTSPAAQARTVENIDKLTEKLSKVDTTIAKTLVDELSKLRNSFSSNSDLVKNFNESLKKYNDAISEKRPETEIKKAYEDLSKVVKDISDSTERYGEASRLGGEVLGQQPQSGRMATMARGFAKAAPYIAGTVQGAIDVAKEGFSFYRTMEAEDIGAMRQTAVGRGQLAQSTFQNYAEQFNPYNARNAMRWYGDVITPGAMQYAGPEGFQRAKESAFTEQAREQKLKESERKQQMMSGIGDLGVSALQLIASRMVMGAVAGSIAGPIGTGVGAVAGGFMAFDAIKDLISGVNRIQSNLAGSPALEVEGGRASTLYGQGANAVFGNQPSADLARRAMDRFSVDRANENLERARELQEAEINRMPYVEQSIGQAMELKQGRYRALPGLGRFAGLPVVGTQRENERFRRDYEQARVDIAMRVATQRAAAMDLTPEQIAGDKWLSASAQELNAMVPQAAQETAFNLSMERSMERDKQGKYVNMPFANLGLGPQEVAQRAYAYQMALGPGQMRTTEAVAGSADFLRLNRMSIGGLGSFEQLTQNLQGIQGITGAKTTDTQKELERIFAKGTEAGFNNSRLAQSLVQTTTSLAEGLNLRNIGGATSTVLETARMMGAGNVNERNVRDATRGIQQLAAMTGAEQGPMAAVRMGAILEGGTGPGKGLGILFGMNSVQAQDAMAQIEALGGMDKARALATSRDPKDRQRILDPRLRALLFSSESSDNLMKSLAGVKDTGTAYAALAWNLYGGQQAGEPSFKETQEQVFRKIKAAKTPKQKEEAEDELYRFTQKLSTRFGEMGPEGVEMANAYIGQLLSDPAISKEQKRALSKQLNVTVDSEQRTQAAFKTAITKFGTALVEGKPTLQQYGALVSAGDESQFSRTFAGRRANEQDMTLTGKQMAAAIKGPVEGITEERRRDILEEIKAGLGKETVSSLMSQRQRSAADLAEPPKEMRLSGIEQTVADKIGSAVASAFVNQSARLKPVFGGK